MKKRKTLVLITTFVAMVCTFFGFKNLEENKSSVGNGNNISETVENSNKSENDFEYEENEKVVSKHNASYSLTINSSVTDSGQNKVYNLEVGDQFSCDWTVKKDGWAGKKGWGLAKDDNPESFGLKRDSWQLTSKLGDTIYKVGGTLTKAGTLSFRFKFGTSWGSGNTKSSRLILNVSPKKLPVPTISNYNKTYTGYQQSPTLNYSGSVIEVSGTTKATSPGTYTVTFRIAQSAQANYTWADGRSSNTEISYNWYISRVNVKKPYISADSYTHVYTGKTITPNYVNYDSRYMKYSGGYSGVDAKPYTVTFTCLNGYQFGKDDYSVSYTWNITRAKLSSNDPSDFVTFKTPVFDWDFEPKEKQVAESDLITISGKPDAGKWEVDKSSTVASYNVWKATNLGKYPIYIKPKANFTWLDGSISSKPVFWEIDYKRYSKPKFKNGVNNFEYDGRTMDQRYSHGWNDLLDSNYNPNNMTVKFYEAGSTTPLSSEPVDYGSYQIEFTLNDNEKTAWAEDKEAGGAQLNQPTRLDFTIYTKVINKPTIANFILDFDDGNVVVPQVVTGGSTGQDIDTYLNNQINSYLDETNPFQYYRFKTDGTKESISKSESTSAGKYLLEINLKENEVTAKDTQWAGAPYTSDASVKTWSIEYSIGSTVLPKPTFAGGLNEASIEYNHLDPTHIFGLPISGFDLKNKYMDLIFGGQKYQVKNTENGELFFVLKSELHSENPTPLMINKPGVYNFSIQITDEHKSDRYWFGQSQGDTPEPVYYTYTVTKDRVVRPKLTRNTFEYRKGQVINPTNPADADFDALDVGVDPDYQNETDYTKLMSFRLPVEPKEISDDFYTVYADLLSPEYCVWVDNKDVTSSSDSSPHSMTFKIIKRTLIKPQLNVTEYTFTNEKIVLQYKDGFAFDPIYMHMEGQNDYTVGTKVITYSLLDPTHYCWSDGTTDPHTQTITISEQEVLKPYFREDDDGNPINTVEYTGENVLPEVIYDDKLITCKTVNSIGAETQSVNVNSYRAKFTLNDTDNYCWKGTNKSDKDPVYLDYSITKKTLNVPTLENPEVFYDGNIYIPKFIGLDTSKMTVQSYTPQKKAGTYSIDIKLNNPNNFKWSNTSSDTTTIQYTIKRLGIETPKITDNGVYSYTGSYITPNVSNLNNTFMSYSYTNNLVVANNNVMTIKLLDKDSTYWKNNGVESTADVNLSFNIIPAVVKRPTIVKSEFDYDGSTHKPIVEDFNETYMEYKKIPIETSANSYSMAIGLKDTVNCSWEGGGIEDIEFDFIINPKIIEMVDLEKEEYEYTGEVIEPEFTSYDSEYVSIVYPESIEPDTYKVTVSLKDRENTVWSDGTNTDKYLIYKIKNKATNLTNNQNNLSYGNSNIGLIIGIAAGTTVLAITGIIILGILRRRKFQADD